jgi:dihydrofolate reductase
MGRIVVTEFVSLDGVVEDPGGTGGFKHKGWSFDSDRRQEGVQSRLPLEVLAYLLDEALGTEAMLLGRTTYEELAALWPARDGELADRLNAMPKYVVSSTLERPAWNNSTVLGGDPVEEVSRLRRELGGEIVAPGSIRLARTLVEHDLVDGLRLMVYPVVLGAGERLFGELPDKKGLRLVDATTLGDGIAVLRYETARGAGPTSGVS